MGSEPLKLQEKQAAEYHARWEAVESEESLTLLWGSRVHTTYEPCEDAAPAPDYENVLTD